MASDVLEGTHVKAYLGGLPATCASRSLKSPCVPHLDGLPPLFYCKWTGVDGKSSDVGPFNAKNLVQTVEGINLALQPYLECPSPTLAEVSRISGYSGDGESVTLGLSVSYSSPDASPFEWEGVQLGNQVTVSNMYTPPTSPPPLSPPSPGMPPSPLPAPPPPPSPPASEWGTISWSGGSQSGGCSYAGWKVYYANLGSMNWKDCMAAASKRKAFVNPGQYTCGYGGWSASATTNGYALSTTSWNAFAQSVMSTSRTCCIAADVRHSNRGSSSSSSWATASFGGSNWLYSDLGRSYTHDTCMLAATQYGANVITPSTVGISSNTEYHIPTHHACCTYQTRSGQTGWHTQNLGSGQRSKTAGCMLGIYLS